MKAALLTGLRQIEYSQVPEPSGPSSREVLLKTELVGVCGSDVHYFVEGRIGDQVVEYPFLVGHEFCATVVEVGCGVKRLRPGDRVAVDPAISCGVCSQCRAGRHHTCAQLRFLGCPGQAEGCLAEFMLMPEDCCFALPEGMSLEAGALVEPLSIGIYAVDMAGPLQDRRVGVLGCGPIGLCVLAPALARGAQVYATDKVAERVGFVRSAGAIWSGNPLTENIVQSVFDMEPEGLDVVFECCGQQDALTQAVELLKPGGTLLIVGIPSEDLIWFRIDELRRKEVCIRNVRRQNGCMKAAIDFLQDVRSMEFLITHRFGLEKAQQAFELVEGYRDGVVKALIHP